MVELWPVRPPGRLIRVWGKKGKGDWNEYWRLDRLLRANAELEAEFRAHGVEHVDICPHLEAPPAEGLLDIEVFIPPGETLHQEDPAVAEIIHRHTGLWVGASPASVESEFEERVARHRLYLRQRFDLWDEVLPRFILGLDFDQGLRNFKLRAKEPEKWRMVDHDCDGAANQRTVLPALLLEPTERGRALLDDLVRTFDYWHPGSHSNYRMPLNDVLDYRKVLLKYGVDCNESFRDGLVEGWYPIDIGTLLNSKAIRTLIATPLPEHLADLLEGDVDGGTGRDYIHFQLVALTEN